MGAEEEQEEGDARADEVELIRAMYSEQDGELSFAPDDGYAFTLRLPVDGCPAPFELRVSLPEGYPAVQPAVRLACDSVSRGGMDALMLGLASVLAESAGEMCVSAVVEWLQVHAPAHVDEKCPDPEPCAPKAKNNTKEVRKNERRGSRCVLWEERGDLFEVGPEWSLCHCVSKDLDMSAGIAVDFKKIFGGVPELKGQKAAVGGVAVLEKKGRHIYYLVTKNKHGGKPSMETLGASLRSMRLKMAEQGVSRVAMPHIGCGLDRLSWGAVQELLLEVFDDMEVELLVRSL